MNGDLISRKAAIDAAKHAWAKGLEPSQYIEDLPSAQPNMSNALSALDCIERQATIDALCDNCDTVDAVCAHYPCKRYLSIENLPSVQTDMSGNMSGTQKALKHTETHSCDYQRTETHEWIPVSEALPEDGVTVWVTIKGHDVIRCEEGETLEQAIARISKIRWVTQGYWSEEEHGWNDPSFGCPLMVQPIAWMPIDTPEPWKGR